MKGLIEEEFGEGSEEDLEKNEHKAIVRMNRSFTGRRKETQMQSYSDGRRNWNRKSGKIKKTGSGRKFKKMSLTSFQRI